MRITRFLLVGLLCLGSYARSQIRACLPEPHTLPDDLRSTLDARLATFLTAQSQEQWDDVAGLLGSKGGAYKTSYRQCLVSRMQELRMVNFDRFTPDLYTCTTEMELPDGAVDRVTAERLSWYVRGTARFQTSSEAWVQDAQIRAYRDHGMWYFVPPQQQMQEKWEKIHYTEADFAVDRRSEIEIPNPPSSPIEITNVHVYMDRQFPSLRNIKFRLHNKTSKKVTQLSLRIGNEAGFVGMGGPYQIEPKGYLALEQSVSAYGDFCDEAWKNAMAITNVSFADGSEWKLMAAGDH